MSARMPSQPALYMSSKSRKRAGAVEQDVSPRLGWALRGYGKHSSEEVRFFI